MKTTVEIPDDLFIAVKKHAAERRTSIRALVESGLRKEISAPVVKRKIKWITVDGGLLPGVDISDRSQMMDFLMADEVGNDLT